METNITATYSSRIMQPVRKIGLGHSSLRAIQPSAKAQQPVQLESALERDFCCLLEFGPDIVNYVEQPVTIDYIVAGCARRYTPDFLVHYVETHGQRPVLAEIKYRADVRSQWPQLKLKMRAAKHYAATKGWEFRLYTEVEIRTPYLKNAKFLLRFKNLITSAHPEYHQLLLEIIAQLGESTPTEILLVAFQDRDRQAELLPVLWQLVSRGQIGCNLFQPLSMQSQLWSLTWPATLLPYDQN